ncbi:MAG: hypothetical protein ABW189_02755 [Rickettsiales bacterium]
MTYHVAPAPLKKKKDGWLSWFRRKRESASSDGEDETTPLLPVAHVRVQASVVKEVASKKSKRSLMVRLFSWFRSTPVPDDNKKLIDDVRKRYAEGKSMLDRFKIFVTMLPKACTLTDSEFQKVQDWKNKLSAMLKAPSCPKNSALAPLSYGELQEQYASAYAWKMNLEMNVTDCLLAATLLEWSPHSRTAASLKMLEKIVADLIALREIDCDDELTQKLDCLNRQLANQPPPVSLWNRFVNAGRKIRFPGRDRAISDISRNNENLRNLANAADAFGKRMRKTFDFYPLGSHQDPASPHNIYDLTETAKIFLSFARENSDALNAADTLTNADIRRRQQATEERLHDSLNALEKIFSSLQGCYTLRFTEEVKSNHQQRYDELKNMLREVNHVYAACGNNSEKTELASAFWLTKEIGMKCQHIVYA